MVLNLVCESQNKQNIYQEFETCILELFKLKPFKGLSSSNQMVPYKPYKPHFPNCHNLKQIIGNRTTFDGMVYFF